MTSSANVAPDAARSAPLPHLVHVFPTFAVGGVQRVIISVARALQEKYRHTVIALDGNFEAAGLSDDPTFSFEPVEVRSSGLLSVHNLRLASRTLRRMRPDLLLTYNWGSVEWTLANRLYPVCPSVHLESGFGADESPERQHWRRIKARRLFLSGCRRIVVPSRVLYDVATRIWRLSAARVLYLPNGIDCDRFARAPDPYLLANYRIDKEAIVVGTVAALRPEKNLTRLVRVFAALPVETRLLIIGEGPERPVLEETAARLGLSSRIVFAGGMERPEQILGRIDVFVLTSDTEQMPNSVLEAMAAGLPIAATDVGDVKRMVAEENRDFIVSVGDEARLAERLRRLVGDQALRWRLGASNRVRVRREYALKQMIKGYDDLFTELLEKHPGSRFE